MVSVVDIPSGAQSGKIYLIDYDEDAWKAFSDEQRQYCKDTWLQKAAPIKNIRFIVLKLYPDELFPMHGHEKPYVEWQYEIDRPPECGFTVSSMVTITLTGEPKHVDPVTRMEVRKRLQEMRYPIGTHYRIVTRGGSILEQRTL